VSDSPLPMFPLGSVVFPTGVLPLHVFEPRYRRLIDDCLSAAIPEFGTTLIERGSEVGGGDTRTDVGTVTRMVQVGRLPDGRYAVIAVGHRRVRVRRWWPDDPYPRAEIDEWPDIDDGFDRSRAEQVYRDVRRVRALAVELGDVAASDDPALPDEASAASYVIADRAPLGEADRQTLLAAPGPAARLEVVARMLGEAEAALVFRLG
jgi:uncharacterized protein